MKRAQSNMKNKKLHDQGSLPSSTTCEEKSQVKQSRNTVKQLCLKDEWFAILTLAEYKDEEDVDYFIGVMKDFIVWSVTDSGLPRKSQFRQLYSALVRFHHKDFWPYLVELHSLAISDPVLFPCSWPDDSDD